MVKQLSKSYGLGRVAFLAKKETIKKELDAGWSKTLVFEKLKLGISYSQFTRYVAKYITPAIEINKTEQPIKVKPTSPAQAGQPQFKFDPQVIDKETLI